MSSQQNQQKCQLPVKCLPKCPPKYPTQAPQAPQPPAPCPPPAPSCCVHSCYMTGFRGCCSPGFHRFPEVCLGPLQPSNCCERESSGCSSCDHGFGGCSF